jgi:hypothetical protein
MADVEGTGSSREFETKQLHYDQFDALKSRNVYTLKVN